MIMQRWTKLARHVLPADLAQYNRDNPALLAQTLLIDAESSKIGGHG